MNRRDFELVAQVVRRMHDDAGLRPIVGSIAQRFATAIQEADGCSGFDRTKFLKQCGVRDVIQS